MSKPLVPILAILTVGLVFGDRALAQQPSGAGGVETKKAAGPQGAADADAKRPDKAPPAAGPEPRPQTPATGTGTINVGRVLEALGLAKQLEQRRTILRQKIQTEVKQMQAKYDAKKKQIGDTPTDAQKRELATLYAECQGDVTRVQQHSDKQWNGIMAMAQDELRKKVAIPIKTIAEKRGLAVVLQVPNNSMAYSAPSADITDEVIEAIRTGSPDGLNVSPLPELILDGERGSGTVPALDSLFPSKESVVPSSADPAPRDSKARPEK